MTDKWVWIPDEDSAWLPAKVLSDGSTMKVEVHGTNQTKNVESVQTTPLHLSSVTDDFNNLVQLEEFSEGAIIHQLRKRYLEDHIYTNIGSILVSVNPFKMLPIYTPNILNKYQARNLEENLDPHVFETASNAYWSLTNDHENQSVLISGESGAGKTEATKLILQYLGEVAASDSGVEQQIMMSNPILEAFGNSKTLKNNNSSRFGKWMEIKFKSGIITSARIVNYLLEKSRVVDQAEGERNYHIFYQLCSGAPAWARDRYNILDAKDYKFLTKGNCLTAEKIDDFDDFSQSLNAMAKLEFGSDYVDAIIRIVTGVLYLGNLEFAGSAGDASEIRNRDVLEIASEILQIPSHKLEESFCYRLISIRGEVQKIKNDPQAASDARDSAAKVIYGNLFDWLVQKINDFLCKAQDKDTIGVLDIFGFEVFERNSFEQFCINYANEKLQNHFNKFIFEMEQNEYIAEGISVETIPFIDNQACLDLIEQNPGLIAMMNEEVSLPKGTDESLALKFHEKFAKSKSAQHPHYDHLKQAPETFMVIHYAGSVTYNIIGFCDKNKDDVYESLLDSLKSSENSLLRDLFVEEDDESSIKSPRGSKRKAKTLASKFKNQLTALMSTLNSTNPHFVRCVKPNSEKSANLFDAQMSLRQMKYAGLFEAIRVRANGFSFRKGHKQFFQRYKPIINTKDSVKPDADGCKKIINVLKDQLDSQHIQLGKTKVFFRPSQLILLEKARDDSMLSYAVLLQSIARSILSRAQLRKLRRLKLDCEEALQKDTIEAITEALDKLKSSESLLELLEKLNERLAYLQSEEKVIVSLNEAISSKDLDQLDGALVRVEKLEILQKTTKEDIKKLVQVAKDARVLIEKTVQLKKDLQKAVSVEDHSALSSLLTEAKSLSIDPSELEEATMLFDRLNKEKALFTEIQSLIDAKDIEKLEESLEKLKDMTLDSETRELGRKAKDAIIEHYKTELSTQLEANDEKALVETMRRIKDRNYAGDMEDLFEKAVTLLESNESKEDQDESTENRRDSKFSQELLGDIRKGTSLKRSPAQENRSNLLESLRRGKSIGGADGIIPEDGQLEVGGHEKKAFEFLGDDGLDASVAKKKKELKKAIAENDTETIEKLMTEVGDDGANTKTMKMGKGMVEKIKEIKVAVLNLNNAIKELDKDKIKSALQEARRLDIDETEDFMKEAKNLLFSIDDIEFRSLQFAKAIENNNAKRLKELIEISNQEFTNVEDVAKAKQFLSQGTLDGSSRSGRRDSVLFRLEGEQDFGEVFENLKGLHKFEDFEDLRPTDNYAKRKLLGKHAVVDTMFIHQVTPIPRSLIKLSTAYCGSKYKSKAIKSEARDLFKNVLGYMRDRYHAYPVTLAEGLLFRGMEEKLLRDEIFCQLIKQTTNNPNATSLVLGFKMIYLCLTTFPPTSQAVTDILYSHIAMYANPLISAHMPFDTLGNVASNCYIQLRKIVKEGAKLTLPTLDEIERVTDSKPLKMVVRCEGTEMIVPVAATNRDMNIEGASHLIASRLRKRQFQGELHLVCEDKKENFAQHFVMEPSTPILSIITFWDGKCRANPNLAYHFQYVLGEMLDIENIPPPPSGPPPGWLEGDSTESAPPGPPPAFSKVPPPPAPME